MLPSHGLGHHLQASNWAPQTELFFFSSCPMLNRIGVFDASNLFLKRNSKNSLLPCQRNDKSDTSIMRNHRDMPRAVIPNRGRRATALPGHSTWSAALPVHGKDVRYRDRWPRHVPTVDGECSKPRVVI